MPASATRQRPPVLVQRQDSLRSDTANEEGGDAFRAAFDDVGGKRGETRRSEQEQMDARRSEERQRARGDRQKDDTRRAGADKDKNRSEGYEPEQARSDQPADSSRSHHEQDSKASRGGFGSDPSVSALAGADGSAGPNRSVGLAGAEAVAHGGAKVATGAAQPSSVGGHLLGQDRRVAASTPWGAGLPDGPGANGALQAYPASAEWSEGQKQSTSQDGMTVALPSPDGADEAQLSGRASMTSQGLASFDVLDSTTSSGTSATAGLDPSMRAGDASLSPTTPSVTQAVGPASPVLTANAQVASSAFRGMGPELTASGDAGGTNAMADPEPMPGSVHLSGVRGARVVVPLEDGETLRARVDVTDDHVDVRLVSSADSAVMAERRESDLRDGLAQKGLQLGEFEVSTSDDGESRASDQSGEEQGGRSASTTDHHRKARANATDRAHASGDGATRALSDDDNGNLLNLRL
ncbi:MAG TPA: hypothetical protein DIU15_04970 [Deltaproteobacteria bacterium]|nr:hypothetical protein [Deltaproteobacteria bacterium]HCP45368.1 hypothetical protein [Deltaproteobacteria bacterium]